MDKTCCIGLCVYNSQPGLVSVIKNINKLISLFSRTVIIFSYHHSSDDTYSIITSYQDQYHDNNYNDNRNNVDIIVNNTRTNVKTTNIAIARNAILDIIRERYNEYEYLIMMDTNNYSCIGELNIENLSDIFLPDKIDKWDAVSFDREAGYYDHWALSFDYFIYSFFHVKDWRTVVEKMRERFSVLLQQYKENNEFMPVFSAFNGFSVYKLNKFIDCNYSSTIDLSLFPANILRTQMELLNENIVDLLENDCEHRHFHLEAIHKHDAKIRIYPKSVFNKLEIPVAGLRGPA